MFDEKNIDRSDLIGQRFGEIKGQVLPPPELEKAIIAGVPYRPRLRAVTHVIRFAKVGLAYAVCIILFLGALIWLPRLFDGGESVVSDPVGGTPVLTTLPSLTDPTPSLTESASDTTTTLPSLTDPTPNLTEPAHPVTKPEPIALPYLSPVSTGVDLSLDGHLTDPADRERVKANIRSFLTAYGAARSTMDPDAIDAALGEWNTLNHYYYGLLTKRIELLRDAGYTSVKSTFVLDSLLTSHLDGDLWASAIETVEYTTSDGVKTDTIYHDLSLHFQEKDPIGFGLDIYSVQDAYIEPAIGLDSEIDVNVKVRASAAAAVNTVLSPQGVTVYRPLEGHNFVLSYELERLDAYDYKITCTLPEGSLGEAMRWITSDGKYVKVEWVEADETPVAPAPAEPADPMTVPVEYDSVGSPDRGTLSAAKEAEIKEAMADRYDDVMPEDVKVKFVANINGKYAVYVDVDGWEHGDMVVTIQTECGLEFISSNTNTMKIYYNGQFYSIPDACEQGVLSKREVQELYVVSQYSSASGEIRDKCALRYGGAADDFFIRFMESGSHDAGKTMWYAVYVYGPIAVRDEIASETVNGLTFYYSNTRMMEIYYEGEFYSLAQAFENGIIDDWDVKWLYYDHVEMRSQEPLNARMDAEIKAAWQSRFGNALGWISDGGPYRYYGTFRGCIVLFEPRLGDAVTVIDVGGYSFYHGNIFEIFVYYNGEFTDLQTAHQIGLIDSDALNTLVGVHNSYR